MSRLLCIASFLLALLTCPILHAAPGSPLPAEDKNYQLLDESFSPDKHLAMMCLKREALDASEEAKQKLFLVAVDPFRIVTEIPVHDSDLLRGHSTYAVKWTPDGSAVLMIEGIKWGPDKAYLVPIHDGRAGKIVDLTAEVEQRVRPDYKKSKAERYNEFYDFIFEDGQDIGDGFTLRKNGEVVIDCICTTDPKHMDGGSWTVRFRGVWNISGARMTNESCKRIKTKPQ